MMTRHPELPERDRRILGVLVQTYIDQGEPVSSLWLASRGFGVSSATLRNVLARLEELGYVRQPHTSAGRVPTDLGYRAYVDQLMAERRAARPGPQVEARLRRAGTVDDLLSHVSQEVSRASHHVGFAIAPASDSTRLEHLEFVPLDAGKILVVVIADGGKISHKVIHPSEPLRAGGAAAGGELSEPRVPRPVDPRRPPGRAGDAPRGAHALRRVDGTRAAAGQLHLRGHGGGADACSSRARRCSSTTWGARIPKPTIQTLRTLLRMIEEKTRLVELLDAYLGGAGLTVVIGSEHRAPDLRSFSIVAATYNDGRGTGTVGVIGPTRMRYSRAINAVDSLTRAINRMVGRLDA